VGEDDTFEYGHVMLGHSVVGFEHLVLEEIDRWRVDSYQAHSGVVQMGDQVCRQAGKVCVEVVWVWKGVGPQDQPWCRGGARQV